MTDPLEGIEKKVMSHNDIARICRLVLREKFGVQNDHEIPQQQEWDSKVYNFAEDNKGEEFIYEDLIEKFKKEFNIE